MGVANDHSIAWGIAKALAETEKALALIPIIDHPDFDIYRDYFSRQVLRFKSLLD